MDGKFIMPKLGYAADALAPVISEETIKLHYGKHLQAYVDNLNRLVPGSPFEGKSLDVIAAKANGPIGNNAGQVLNHVLYFSQFFPNGKSTTPSVHLLHMIEQAFGSMDDMRARLSDAAVSLFGSGWAWLTMDGKGGLQIHQMQNADNPLRHGLHPLLTIDVWEHAYYVDYQNRRADHVKAVWDIIDWNVVSARAEKCRYAGNDSVVTVKQP